MPRDPLHSLARGPAWMSRAAVARPGWALAAAPGLLRLELRTDGHALVPPDDPVVRFDAEVRQRFGLRDPMVVMVEADHPAGIYNPETLRRIRDLSSALAALDWVGEDGVTSLATESRDEVYPGTLRFRSFLDPLPETAEEIAALRSDLDAAELLYGTLVAADGRAATVLVGVPADRAEVAAGGVDRGALHRDVLSVAGRFAGEGHRVSVLGAPVAEALLGAHVLADLARLLPLAMMVLAAATWIACRRLWGVLLALLEVGACLVWTFGLMGWLGAPVYLTTGVLPVVLVSIGLADEIHVFWHYQRLLGRGGGGPHPATVVRALDEMAAPVTLTTLTTSIGLLSFAISPIAPVRSFGLFAAAGIAFCWLWTFTAVPALLALAAPERMARPPGRRAPGRRLRAFAAPLVRRRGWTLAAFAALSLAAAGGLPRLAVQDGWIDGFAPGDPFRRATVRFHERFAGSHLLLAHLSFAGTRDEGAPRVAWRSGPLLDPGRLAAIGRFEAAAAGLGGVGGVLGPHSHLTAVSYLAGGRRPEARGIPETHRGVERAIRRFEQARGERRRREVIDDELTRGVVTVFLREANFRDTAVLMGQLRTAAAEHLEPFGGRLDFAGDVAVSQAMIPAIVRTQVGSLLLALLGALAAVSLAYRSPARGALAVLPAAAAVLWTFGAMGWAGLPLGVATSMFCAVTLGVGVDYAVHLLERIRRARASGVPEPALAGVEEAGPAIVADALAVAAGFALLATSQVPASARLGVVVAGALLAACAASLGVLAPLVARHAERSPSR